ncbi:MAG: hypothetical protein ACE5GC_01585 [Acidimicrobiia bacterium]
MLVVAACSSTTAPAAAPTTSGDREPVVVANNGGSREGHTPWGFAGMGTGLFAGDNLNPSFPEGDGVQIFLTFELPDAVLDATSVALASDALSVAGSPFEDLGALIAEVVSYDAFGPSLFGIPGLSDPADCTRVDATGLQCDVSEIVSPLLAGGDTTVQLRLKFERPADNDGRPDLAMFFRSDSNTNEPGLFTLTIGR